MLCKGSDAFGLTGMKQILPTQNCCISLMASLINRDLWANGSAGNSCTSYPTYITSQHIRNIKNSSQVFDGGI